MPLLIEKESPVLRMFRVSSLNKEEKKTKKFNKHVKIASRYDELIFQF